MYFMVQQVIPFSHISFNKNDAEDGGKKREEKS